MNENFKHAHNNPFELRELLHMIRIRIKLILILVVLGIISAYIFNLYQIDYYQSDFVIRSNMITGPETVILLDDLKKIHSGSTISELSEKMNTGEEAILSIKSFNFTALSHNELNNTVHIMITTYDMSMIPEIVKGIMFHLNNNQYTQNLAATEKEKYTTILEKIQLETKELETNKKRVNAILSENSPITRLYFSPADIHFTLVQLKDLEIKIKKKLDMAQAYEIMKTAIIPTKPTGPKRIKTYLLFTVVAFVAGVFLAIILENYRIR